MIICLMFLCLIIAGVVLFVLSRNRKFSYDTRDTMTFIGAILIIVGFGVTAIIGTSAIIIQVNEDVDYQNMMHKKDMLEYRIEHMDDNIIGNEMLYNDIVEFNNELRTIKKWANNQWTNWFNNQDIATIDYIELNNT